MSPLPDYCGCCGRPTTGTWCVDCVPHVDHNATRPSEATYFAQHGEDCPYQDYDDEPWAGLDTPGNWREPWEEGER